MLVKWYAPLARFSVHTSVCDFDRCVCAACVPVCVCCYCRFGSMYVPSHTLSAMQHKLHARHTAFRVRTLLQTTIELSGCYRNASWCRHFQFTVISIIIIESSDHHRAIIRISMRFDAYSTIIFLASIKFDIPGHNQCGYCVLAWFRSRLNACICG